MLLQNSRLMTDFTAPVIGWSRRRRTRVVLVTAGRRRPWTNDDTVSGPNNVVVTDRSSRPTVLIRIQSFSSVIQESVACSMNQGGRRRPPHTVRS